MSFSGVSRAVASALLLALPACGGGAGPAPASPRGGGSQAREDSSAGGQSDDEQAADPAADLCRDGTCFRCGDGVCPTGFFCDEKAKGGAACSWVPECAKDAGCDCLASALGSGCSCETRDGGAHVTCG